GDVVVLLGLPQPTVLHGTMSNATISNKLFIATPPAHFRVFICSNAAELPGSASNVLWTEASGTLPSHPRAAFGTPLAAMYENGEKNPFAADRPLSSTGPESLRL